MVHIGPGKDVFKKKRQQDLEKYEKWHVLPRMLLALAGLCQVRCAGGGNSNRSNVPAAAGGAAAGGAAAAFHKGRVRPRPHRPTCTGHRKGCGKTGDGHGHGTALRKLLDLLARASSCIELHRVVIDDDRVIDCDNCSTIVMPCHVLSHVVISGSLY